MNGHISAEMEIIDYDSTSDETWKEGLRATISQEEAHDDDLITSKRLSCLIRFHGGYGRRS